jgi:diguanylate cyclase (GGDEF)-like protein
MHFLTIENLCLAAEAVMVLLLIAFPWGTNRKSQESSTSSHAAMDWELVKSAFTQACVFRGLYVQRSSELNAANRDDESAEAALFATRDSHDRIAAGEIPEPWQDRLTKLLNRAGFDQVLRTWMRVGQEHRKDSSVALISMTGYSNLLGSHGAIIVEQALRALADKLSDSLGHNCLIARYQAERFIVLSYCQSSGRTHLRMEALQHELSNESFFQSGDTSFGLESIVSIAALGDESDAEQVVNQLDEGFLQADDRGYSVVSLQEGEWEDQPRLETAPSRPTKAQAQTAPESSFGQDDSVSHEREDAGELTSESIEESNEPVTSGSVEEEAIAPSVEKSKDVKGDDANHDISAVANPADIEALFAEIKAKKAKAGHEGTPITEPKPPTNEASKTSSLSDAASADDIAALFAANAPAKVKAKEKAPDIDATEAATADDIAALFATVKQATAPTKGSPSSKPQEKQPALETASVTAEPSQPPTAEELNTVASADDIASLFATVKPSGKPQEQIIEQPSAPSAGELTDTASAEDIAALFASVKQTPAPSSTTPTDPVTPPIPTGEELQNAASADDIAALFAAMKK